MFVDINEALKLKWQYAETWVFVVFSGQWLFREKYPGFIILTMFSFLPESSFGLQVLSLPACVCMYVCVCVYVCVRVSINHELVRVITYQLFKLEPPNLNKKMQNNLVKVPIVLGGNQP